MELNELLALMAAALKHSGDHTWSDEDAVSMAQNLWLAVLKRRRT